MKPTSEQLRAQARRKYESEGYLEIDDNAPISGGGDDSNSDSSGAYVQAWVWVDYEDVPGFESK